MKTSELNSSKILQFIQANKKVLESYPFRAAKTKNIVAISSIRLHWGRIVLTEQSTHSPFRARKHTHTHTIQMNYVCTIYGPLCKFARTKKDQMKKKEEKTNRTRYKQIKRNIRIYSIATIFYLWYTYFSLSAHPSISFDSLLFVYIFSFSILFN